MRRTRKRERGAGRARGGARGLRLALAAVLGACLGAAAGTTRAAGIAEGDSGSGTGTDGAPLAAPADSIQAPVVPGAATAESLFGRAERAFNAGRLQQALDLYQQVPTGSPLAGRAMFGEGCCRAALGQIDPAIRLFQQVQDYPDTTLAGRLAAADATDLLGRIYLDLGRSEAARRAFHELARRSPQRGDYAAVMVAQSYRDDGAWFDAYAALKPVLQEGRSDQAYDLALDLYWNLDAAAQRELSRLLRTHLARPNRELTDNRSR